jgi:hypothetical protein
LSRPCIISLGECVYRLDDGPPVLVGTQQDELLQEFLRKQMDDAFYRVKGAERREMLACWDRHEWLRLRGRLRTTVSMDTEYFRECTDPGMYGRNFAKIMKSLKRGPLGPAIELPGRHRKGHGYIVHIQGCPDGYA